MTDEQIEYEWRSAVETSLPVEGRTHFRFARAIEAAATAPLLARIAELEAKLAQRGPDGWKLVPMEPTAKMLAAVVSSMDEFMMGVDAEKQYRDDWSAMLAAAPVAPEQQDHSEQHLAMVAQASNAQQAEAQEPAMFQFRWTNPGGDQKRDAGAMDWRKLEPRGTESMAERIREIERHTYNDKPCYEVRALFTRPQPAQRPPLTIAEVEAIIARWSYELHGDRARFIVRETELAHGIGEKE